MGQSRRCGTVSKQLLRRELLDIRAVLSRSTRREESAKVRQRLHSLPILRQARVVVGYHPLPTEVDLLPLLRALRREGKTIGLPRVVGRDLEVRAWRPADRLRTGPFRIKEPPPQSPLVEPVRIGAVLVPGLGFDRHGYRLGFGKGYFDRFLAGLPKATRVGIAFRECVRPRLPRTRRDVPMDWVVTPDEAFPILDRGSID